MIEMIYNILDLAIFPFRMIDYNIVVVPFAMLIVLMVITIFIRLVKGEYK